MITRGEFEAHKNDPNAHHEEPVQGSGGGFDADMLDGHHWSEIPWQVLAEVEVASDCDYVDFTGLDINRDWEYYLDVILKNPTSLDSGYYLFVEGDYTNANYCTQFLHSSDTSVTAFRRDRSEFTWLTPGWRNLSNVRMTRDPDGYFRYISITNRSMGSSQEIAIRMGSKTAPVSNITSIRVSAERSGAIGAGSRFILARPRS